MQILSAILQTGPEVLIVTGVNKPPNYPLDEYLALLSDHMTKLKSKEATKHVICGDFNINVFLEDRKVSKLIEMLSYFRFLLKNNQKATRETTCSKTCIDLFFSNIEGVCNVDKTALSDHYTIYFSANFFANLDTTPASKFINSQFKKLKEKKIWKKNYLVHLEIKEQRLMIESLDIDQSIEWLQQTIISSKESKIPTVQQTKPRSTIQWITATIRNLANKKKKLIRLYLRDNTTEPKNKYKIICRKTKAACKLAKKNFMNNRLTAKMGHRHYSR